MKYLNRKKLISLTVLLLACSLAAGCGCGKKKEKDASSQQVMKISITPAVTPTKAPSEVNKDAVVTNGNMTMVNEYLAEKDAGSSAGGDTQGADGTGAEGGNGTGAEGDNGAGDENQDESGGAEE